ncbi:MAG TPA: YncE family protein, partial [Bacteroidota bacterium]|nr:YncE family protein [Bacteroidota bacterium]
MAYPGRRHIGRGILGLALMAMPGSGVQQPLAAGGDGGAPKAYVTEFRSNSVGVIDTRGNRVTRHIPVPPGAHGIAMLPDGSRVFVSSDESSTISCIDAVTDEIIGTIPTGKQPHGLACSTDGRFVYACIFGDNQVLEIEPHLLTVVRSFEAPKPHNLAVAPDGKALYVAAQDPGKTGILKINLTTGKTESFLRSVTIPRSLNLSPDGQRLVSTQADRNEVQFYRTVPLEQLQSVPVGGAPHHVIFSGEGRLVLVVNQVTNDLTVINAATMAVTRTIAVGKKPHWIAPTADGKYAYVTDESSDQVSLVDLDDGDVEQ